MKELFKRIMARVRGDGGFFDGGTLDFARNHHCDSCETIASALLPGDQMTCHCGCTLRRMRAKGTACLRPRERVTISVTTNGQPVSVERLGGATNLYIGGQA